MIKRLERIKDMVFVTLAPLFLLGLTLSPLSVLMSSTALLLIGTDRILGQFH